MYSLQNTSEIIFQRAKYLQHQSGKIFLLKLFNSQRVTNNKITFIYVKFSTAIQITFIHVRFSTAIQMWKLQFKRDNYNMYNYRSAEQRYHKKLDLENKQTVRGGHYVVWRSHINV